VETYEIVRTIIHCPYKILFSHPNHPERKAPHSHTLTRKIQILIQIVELLQTSSFGCLGFCCTPMANYDIVAFELVSALQIYLVDHADLCRFYEN